MNFIININKSQKGFLFYNIASINPYILSNKYLVDGQIALNTDNSTLTGDLFVNNNTTNIVDRENKFINEVCAEGLKIVPSVHPDIIRKFTNYWTERNKSGSKMLFELNKTWDTNRRLRRWVDSDFNKSKIVPKEKYKSNGRGEFKVWCAKCNKDLYYKEYHIKQQISTSCCGADFKAEKL